MKIGMQKYLNSGRYRTKCIDKWSKLINIVTNNKI